MQQKEIIFNTGSVVTKNYDVMRALKLEVIIVCALFWPWQYFGFLALSQIYNKILDISKNWKFCLYTSKTAVESENSWGSEVK